MKNFKGSKLLEIKENGGCYAVVALTQNIFAYGTWFSGDIKICEYNKSNPIRIIKNGKDCIWRIVKI